MMQYPTLLDVQAAAARIKPYAHRTPVFTCTSLNHLVGAQLDRKSTRLNSSHIQKSRMPSSA